MRDETGLVTDYQVDGDYPAYGNNNDEVDSATRQLAGPRSSWTSSASTPTYRDAEHTQSVLTITSNVVYGKGTGSTPDGRKAGEPFAPGANPMHGRDAGRATSPARCRSRSCRTTAARDGISLTNTVLPSALGSNPRRTG